MLSYVLIHVIKYVVKDSDLGSNRDLDGRRASSSLVIGGEASDSARGFGPRIIGPILIAIGLYLLSAMVLNAILSPEQEDLAENLGADRDAGLAVTVAAGALIVVGAAIGEELFFRGFIFGGLRQTLPLWPRLGNPCLYRRYPRR